MKRRLSSEKIAHNGASARTARTARPTRPRRETLTARLPGPRLALCAAPDIVALVVVTFALLWLVPALERHADWLPFHTEWSGLHLPLDRSARLPALPIQ